MQSVDSRLVRVKTLHELLGIGISTLWRWANEKEDFPKPIRVTRGVTLWDLEAVRTWLLRRDRLESEIRGTLSPE